MTSCFFYPFRRRREGAIIGLALSAMLLAAGCAGKPQRPSPATQPASTTRNKELATTRMRIGSRTFDLEIARSDSELENGLMNRDAMPGDHGMIFVFSVPQELQFWMKDTRFPLDIIFLAADGKVVSVQHMKAYDLNTTPSGGVVQYAIELNLGAAAAAGVSTGDRLNIPADARAGKP